MPGTLFSSMSPDRRKFTFQTITAAVITAVLGVLLHFAYDFANQNSLVALFSPVNESTWEHLKLLFFPMVICLLIMFIFVDDHSINTADYLYGIAAGSLSGCASIVILYYFLTGIIGKNLDWLNILIYFAGVIIGYLVFYGNATESFSITRHPDRPASTLNIILPILIIAIVTICFFIFTFNAPHSVLFLDPITSTYGI